jgi:RNA-directed DNA polymerase
MASAANQLENPPTFQRLTDASTLRAAWAHVRRDAGRSSSRAVRLEARRFEDDADRHLDRIAAELRAERFAFGAARGLAVTRPGKRARPLVIAPLESRVVSRALLDVLQTTPGVAAAFLATPTSFGGLPGRGVEQAVGAALDAVQRGAVFYVRSDIADFFRAIPRDRAVAAIGGEVADARLLGLLDLATRTELDNLAALGEHAALFPGAETGVAQGGSLSTLLGNALLRGFDEAMNSRGIACLRYVDDLLLLGPRAAHVKKAFASAARHLATLGLRAYDPEHDPAKAAAGHAAGGIEWLGCEIKNGRARPSLRSRRALITQVERILARSERTVGGASSAIGAVEELLAGFRGAYGFCATPEVFAALDAQIGRRVERYFRANRPRLVAPDAKPA